MLIEVVYLRHLRHTYIIRLCSLLKLIRSTFIYALTPCFGHLLFHDQGIQVATLGNPLLIMSTAQTEPGIHGHGGRGIRKRGPLVSYPARGGRGEYTGRYFTTNISSYGERMSYPNVMGCYDMLQSTMDMMDRYHIIMRSGRAHPTRGSSLS